MAIWQWSTSPASNATADPTIAFPEGQPPSSLNDACRVMMARIAEWRSDTNGSLVTTGTSTAYAVTTNASAGGNGLSNPPPNGTMISATMHVTNGGAPTLSADSGSAYAIQSAAGIAVPASSLIIGAPYEFVFNTSLSTWIARGFFGSSLVVPIGGIIYYISTTPPNGNFALLNGQAISRTTYSVLFGIMGTTFGPGDGSTTFNIPKLDGRAIFGLDTTGAGLITVGGGNWDGTIFGNTGGVQNRTLSIAQIPSHGHPGSTAPVLDPTHAHSIVDPGHSNPVPSGMANFLGTSGAVSGAFQGGTGFNFNATSFTGSAVTGISVNASGTGITVSNNIAAQGGGASHPTMPPGMSLPVFMRII